MAIVGINPVSPRAQPQQQQREKESAFDKVMKGLSAANSAFGIAVNFQKFGEIQQQKTLNEQSMRLNDLSLAEKEALGRGETTPASGLKQGLIPKPSFVEPRYPPGTKIEKSFTDKDGKFHSALVDVSGELIPIGREVEFTTLGEGEDISTITRPETMMRAALAQQLEGKTPIEQGRIVSGMADKEKKLAEQQGKTMVKENEFGQKTEYLIDENRNIIPGSGRVLKEGSLSAEKQKRFDNVRDAIVALSGMDAALIKGDNTFMLVGDNDFTMNRKLWDEALGRMQSGGAITKDEEMRFSTMVPTVGDTKEVQAKKLNQMRNVMIRRLEALDIKGGFEVPEIHYLRKQEPSKEMSAEDKEALEWAKKNSDKPQAKEILRMLGE